MTEGRGAEVAVNARFRTQSLTGVQRVPAELLAHMSTPVREIRPAGAMSAAKGYAWEQFVLPFKAKGRVLWSPCNVGPVASRRQVLTIHDAAVLDHPEWFAPAFVRAYRTIWALAVPRLSRLVTVSAFSRTRLARHFGIPEGRIEVVPNAVSEAFVPAGAEAIARVRERFQLGEGPYVATLATHEPRKNLKLALRAFDRVRHDAILVLIGGSGSAAVFTGGDRVGGGLERVRTLGRVPDEMLPALLSGARALVYPSLYEGFGLPPLEAMSCGTPVITTRLASLPEVVGDAALYVEPDDDAGLAALINRLLDSDALAAELAGKGLAQARLFSWTKSGQRMDDILADALKR